jgi:glycosyltransferase involved in cell wall biosynthesis
LVRSSVTVVVPAYNEERMLPSCLRALVEQQTKYNLEVIVVDNASTDHTTEAARQWENRLNLRVLHESRRGRGAARRTGFAAARTAIVFSTDADSQPPSNWIESLVGAFEEDSDIVAVSGSSYIVDGSRLANFTMKICMPLSLRLYRLLIGHYMLTGANFAIKRAIYEKSGGFDAACDMLDDVDLSFRVARLGKIRYLSRPKVKTEGDIFGRGYFRGFWHYFRHFPPLLQKYGCRRLRRD